MRAVSSSRHGRVASRPRPGTVVRPRAAWTTLDPDVLHRQLGETPDAAFVRDLFDLRRFIEPQAAARAAVKTLLVQAEADAISRLKDGEGGR